MHSPDELKALVEEALERLDLWPELHGQATSVRYAFWALAALISGIVIFAYVSLVKPMSVVEPEPVLEPVAA